VGDGRARALRLARAAGIRVAPTGRCTAFDGSGGRYSPLVIEPEVERPRAESARLRCALLDIDAPIDVIVVSGRHVEEWGGVEGTLVHTALTEGRVLSG